MVSLTEALAAERENLDRNSAENEARREVGRQVLSVLFERLTKESLLGWSFVMKNDEIVVSHMKAGIELKAKHRLMGGRARPLFEVRRRDDGMDYSGERCTSAGRSGPHHSTTYGGC